jgi:cytosine/adenosine deaminase-related metal-dependent hydrolase
MTSRPWLRGETHGRAKLTEEQVRAIKQRYVWRDRANGVTAMAREYRVHRETVRDIVRGVNWGHVT